MAAQCCGFGVPQLRQRHFLVGYRDGKVPEAPRGEHIDVLGRNLDMDAPSAVRLEEAIFDLPPRDAGTSAAVGAWDQPLQAERSLTVALPRQAQLGPTGTDHLQSLRQVQR
jgi:hypothetical protein